MYMMSVITFNFDTPSYVYVFIEKEQEQITNLYYQKKTSSVCLISEVAYVLSVDFGYLTTN